MHKLSRIHETLKKSFKAKIILEGLDISANNFSCCINFVE